MLVTAGWASDAHPLVTGASLSLWQATAHPASGLAWGSVSSQKICILVWFFSAFPAAPLADAFVSAWMSQWGAESRAP